MKVFWVCFFYFIFVSHGVFAETRAILGETAAKILSDDSIQLRVDGEVARALSNFSRTENISTNFWSCRDWSDNSLNLLSGPISKYSCVFQIGTQGFEEMDVHSDEPIDQAGNFESSSMGIIYQGSPIRIRIKGMIAKKIMLILNDGKIPESKVLRSSHFYCSEYLCKPANSRRLLPMPNWKCDFTIDSNGKMAAPTSPELIKN
jgi:hypothetical protein